MLSHYTSVFFKVLWKNKIPNLINILGLLVGMTSAIVIGKYVGYSLTFDYFHQNQQHIFQLRQTETKSGTTEYVGGLTYRGIPIVAQQTIPEIINYTTFNQGVETLVMVANEEGEIIEHGIFAVDSSFLHMFTFEALQGNQESALSHPNSAVMTHSVAQKYFGDKNPIGQIITTRVSWGKEQNWTVTCVLEDLPKNSSIQFDILLFGSTDQDKLWEAPVYNQFIQTTTTSDPEEVSRKISSHISSLPIFKNQGRKVSVMLTPLTPSLTTFEFMLALIGLFILLLSWINFINLSIAQSLNRSGEVVIRKALGSSNRQLVEQFVFESLFMNCSALLMTILFLSLSYDYFVALTGNHLLPLFDNSLHINTLFFVSFLKGGCWP